jgi:hypothetical protein
MAAMVLTGPLARKVSAVNSFIYWEIRGQVKFRQNGEALGGPFGAAFLGGLTADDPGLVGAGAFVSEGCRPMSVIGFDERGPCGVGDI